MESKDLKSIIENKDLSQIDRAIKCFEQLKETAPSVRDLVYLDGVLAVLDSIKKADEEVKELPLDEARDELFNNMRVEMVQEMVDNVLNILQSDNG